MRRIVFSARSLKTCMVTVVVFGVLLLCLLESPINYEGGCYSRKKENKPFFFITSSLVWNIDVY